MFLETIKDEHEARHTADDHPLYNESSYYNFYSQDAGIVGWARVGIQENQPASIATVVLWPPTGETLLAFARTADYAHDKLRVGPLTLEIVEPHRQQRVLFDAEMSVLTEPRALSNPKQAFADAPHKHVRLELTNAARGASFGSNGEGEVASVEQTMSVGHYEQFGVLDGEVRIGDTAYNLSGAGGVRDHSWGPRDWQGPFFHRWVTCILDDGTQLMAMEVGRRDGSVTRNAATVTADGDLQQATLTGLDLTWTDDGFVRGVVSHLATEDGDFDLIGTVRQPEQFVPLRHVKKLEDGTSDVTRIGYSAYEFTTPEGRTGIGVVEVLDQMTDGVPYGVLHQ